VKGPDSTAVRTALWRALHVELDAPPHVFEDTVGLALAAPEDGWRARGDMHPMGTQTYRASIVARARFVEDLIDASEIDQYVLLGAGLDTFAQRRPALAGRLQIFEVDQPGPQAWKRERLAALGLAVPASLHFVPVDFEAESWWDALARAGFDAHRRSLVASLGVSMYLTREANEDTLRRIATLAPGSTLVLSFLRPAALLGADDRAGLEHAERGARASGTPFVSFFAPADIVALAERAGFRTVEHVSAEELGRRYFAGRSDGLRMSSGEELIVART
jgi:methyltransferase (TIGR00027 family)